MVMMRQSAEAFWKTTNLLEANAGFPSKLSLYHRLAKALLPSIIQYKVVQVLPTPTVASRVPGAEKNYLPAPPDERARSQ